MPKKLQGASYMDNMEIDDDTTTGKASALYILGKIRKQKTLVG